MSSDRSTVDAETDVEDDARVCVVATRPETFERCRAGYYPCPRSYDRTRAHFTHMAFYRTAPVSAIPHYARVTGRVEQARGESGRMDADDWSALIDPFSMEEVVVVFALGPLVPLARPVENDSMGVRGAWYCSVDDLRSTESLSALSTRIRGGGDDP